MSLKFQKAFGSLERHVPSSQTLNVIGFRFGIRYADFWGHRGFAHSLLFAALLALVIVALRFRHGATVLVANPTSFLAQKILIHHDRDYKDRAEDLLYTHDRIELFSEHLGSCGKSIRSTCDRRFTRSLPRT